MGSCLSCIKKDSSKTTKTFVLNYPRSIVLEVPKWNKRGEVEDLIQQQVQLTNPSLVLAREARHTNRKYFISACILPGLKSETLAPKICQDQLLICEDGNSILMVIYDGHGNEGHKVSTFCSQELEFYYLEHKQDFINSPRQALTMATQHCDQALCQSGIQISTSGTTQVIALIQGSNIYLANVGDSRAILGSGAEGPLMPTMSGGSNEEWESTLEDLRKERSIPDAYPTKPFQLTSDHKPESDTEMMRILEMGGCIKKKCNQGVKSGPYRVYKLTESVPGLATSRTIGDRIAKQVGVICDPEIFTHSLQFEQDEFVIIATDGLWNVMSNDEVVNFVAAYKENCQKELEHSLDAEPNPSNACIAHLLCEEARLRWLKIASMKKVTVDDISCIVLDLNKDKNDLYLEEPVADKSSKVMPVMPELVPHAEKHKELFLKKVMNYVPFEAGRCP